MAIIAPPPSYKLVEAFPPRDGNKADLVTYRTTGIIAFRIEAPNFHPKPITVMGEAGETKAWAVIHPDGRCSAGGDGYVDAESWKRDMGFEG